MAGEILKLYKSFSGTSSNSDVNAKKSYIMYHKSLPTYGFTFMKVDVCTVTCKTLVTPRYPTWLTLSPLPLPSSCLLPLPKRLLNRDPYPVLLGISKQGLMVCDVQTKDILYTYAHTQI